MQKKKPSQSVHNKCTSIDSSLSFWTYLQEVREVFEKTTHIITTHEDYKYNIISYRERASRTASVTFLSLSFCFSLPPSTVFPSLSHSLPCSQLQRSLFCCAVASWRRVSRSERQLCCRVPQAIVTRRRPKYSRRRALGNFSAAFDTTISRWTDSESARESRVCNKNGAF